MAGRAGSEAVERRGMFRSPPASGITVSDGTLYAASAFLPWPGGRTYPPGHYLPAGSAEWSPIPCHPKREVISMRYAPAAGVCFLAVLLMLGGAATIFAANSATLAFAIIAAGVAIVAVLEVDKRRRVPRIGHG